MYQFYPNEELILEITSSPTLKARKKARYLLVLGAVLLLVTGFYYYASKQDFILNIVTVVALVGSIISFVAYFVVITKTKAEEKYNYYITSSRVIQVDSNGNLVNEVLRSKIKRVDVEAISGNNGDIIINPRELSAQQKYKNELKGKYDQKYTKDTFIITDVSNVNHIVKVIKG